MRVSRFLLLIFISLAVPSAMQAQEAKTDRDNIQGVWEVATAEQEGKDFGEFVKEVSPKWIFNGTKYTFKAGPNSEDGKFKLDTTGKLCAIDLIITEGKDKGKYQLGIYQLDGNNLKMCFAAVGTPDRPAAFATKAKTPAAYVLVTLKRQKKE